MPTFLTDLAISDIKGNLTSKTNLPLSMFRMFIKLAPPAGGGMVSILYPFTPGREATKGAISLAL